MERIIHLCFLLAALIIVAVGVLLYTGLTQGHGVTVRAHQINEVLDAVHRVRINYIDAEKAAYKHAVSGNPTDFGKTGQLLNTVAVDIAVLGELLSNDADQSARQRQLADAYTRLDPIQDAAVLAAQVGKVGATTTPRRDFLDVVSDISNGSLADLEKLDGITREHFRKTLIKLTSMVSVGLLLLVVVYLIALQQLRIRKRAEALLRDNTLFQKAILDSARISIITTDCKGIIQSFNVGAEQKLGYGADELVGRATPARFHDEQECRDKAQAVSLELGVTLDNGFDALTAKASRGHIDEQEWTYIRKDGSRFPVFVSITALRSEQSEIIGYLGMAIDITERKHAEAQLIQARIDAEAATRATSTFLATMSHEIRTPMNGVVGMAEVLARSSLSQHQTEIVQTILDSSGVLLRLIDDILDFSKIEAGRLELEEAPVCVREVAEAICTSLLPIASKNNVDLRVFISPSLPDQVWADDVRLRQVLYNLVGNAIKFSGGRPAQRGRVQLRVETVQASPLKVAFRVIDNGVGIAPDMMDELFSAFMQAEASTTRRFGGTGLGLAICKRIVELAEGDIVVESTPDVGSRFTVTLPFRHAPARTQSSLPDLAGLDCIVVENTQMDAADLVAYLEARSARVSTAIDLGDAARIIARMPTTAPVVVLHDGVAEQGQLHNLETGPLGASDASHVRHLLLTQGSRRQARVRRPGVVSMDVDAMTWRSFLQAVAVAAGRASPQRLHAVASAVRAEPPVVASRPGIAEARAQGRLILVAEDDIINQKVILHQLGVLGYAAEIARTGAEALRMWRVGRYGLLLTDLHMPELDGCGLTNAIRAEESPASRLPILALTANALRGESGEPMACGMDGYLTKPVRLEVLRKALEKWMPSPEGTQPANVAAGARTAGPADTAAILDVNVLKALVGGDEAMVRELLVEFQTVSQQQAAALHQALNAGDIALTSAVAHKLKSSSRSVGALALGDACAELENAGKQKNQDAVQQCMLTFDAALAEVDGALTSLLARRL